MICVITVGDYEDWQIIGCVQCPQGRDWKADFDRYKTAFGVYVEAGNVARRISAETGEQWSEAERDEAWGAVLGKIGIDDRCEREDHRVLWRLYLESLGYEILGCATVWERGTYEENSEW